MSLTIDRPLEYVNGDLVLSDHSRATGDAVDLTTTSILVGDVATLEGHAVGGDDIVQNTQFYTFNDANPPFVIGDALDISDHARGGDDQVTALGVNFCFSIGDSMILEGHGTGGNDTVSAVGLSSLGGHTIAIGDADSMTGFARGGDDRVDAHVAARLFFGEAYGDAESMSGHSHGGNDTVSGTVAYGDAHTLSGMSVGGDDVLEGYATFPYVINQLYGDGAELLDHAHGGNDTLVGTSSPTGSASADQMWGDAATVDPGATTGADLFVFAPKDGHDEIMDFEPGKDHIELQGFGLSFQGLENDLQSTPDGVLISFDAGNDILLHGVSASQLSSGDFIFA